MMLDLDAIDGRVGEAWSGDVPDGSHINVVLARRGSATAAAGADGAGPAAAGTRAAGCLPGRGQRRAAGHDHDQQGSGDGAAARALITWGAAQLGVGQGVMDAVADGTLPAEQAGELVLLVAVWVDPDAADETAVRLANRDATLPGDPRRARRPTRRARVQRARRPARRPRANAFYSGE